MSKIKVMHLIARLNVGGAALYVIELIDHLNQSGCQGQLLCGVVGKAEGDMQYESDQRGLSVTIIPSLGREISLMSDLKTVYTLWRLMRRERPDIVHTHTAKAGFVGRLAARLAGIPVVIHFFNGHIFSGYFGPAKTRVFILLEQLCARLSNKIITVSEGQKHELSAVYHITNPEHIEVIETGFELGQLAKVERHRGNFRKQYDIPENAPLVGIIGRLVLIKNHELFLQAAKRVHECLPDAYFALVGDGERRAELEALAHLLGLTDRFRITGWITDMLPVYSGLDALVLSSRNEGLPVCLIESMAAGVPVISTAVGGIPDLLENGQMGMLVPPSDAPAMAEAIIAALTDPAIREKTVVIRKRALDHYSIDRSLEQTLLLYRQLLSQPNSRAIAFSNSRAGKADARTYH